MGAFLLISIPASSALSWEASVRLSRAGRGDWVLVAAALRGEVAMVLAAGGLSPQPVGPMGPNIGKPACQPGFITRTALHPI